MSTEPWVYTGTWTDWSEGRINGSRLTLTTDASIYFIAFLAIFVRLAGHHFWSILCFITFHLRVSPSAQDGLYLEQQAILRNSKSEEAAVYQFFTTARAWHGRAPRAKRRTLAFIAVACVQVISFTVAGIFVSKVASTNSGVLLRGPICGTWIDPAAFDLYTEFTAADLEERNRWAGWHMENLKSAATFSQQCYNTTDATSSLANCKAYGPRLLTWNTTTGAACPFESRMCANDTVVSFDSGLLDSQTDFGINAKNDRVKYRTVLQCAPIVQDGFRSDIILGSSDIATEVASGLRAAVTQEEYREFYYGPSRYFNTTATYIWDNISYSQTINAVTSRYLLDLEVSLAGNPNSGTFTAIDSLNRTDADVTLFFLEDGGVYLSPVDDPWYQATTPYVKRQHNLEENGTFAEVSFYIPDHEASVMGCAQQHQFCNRDASRCSPLTGGAVGSSLDAMHSFAEDLGLSSRETAIQERMYRAAWNNVVYSTASGAGQLASSIGASDVSPGLPSNQWILEVQRWFTTGLTGMQMEMTSYVTGPQDASAYQYVVKPDGQDESWMCDNQIVQRNGYTNLSGLGVGLILGIGVLLIVVDFVLHRFVRTFRTMFFNHFHDRSTSTDWERLGVLHLLRQVYHKKRGSDWRENNDSMTSDTPSTSADNPPLVFHGENSSALVGPFVSSIRVDSDRYSRKTAPVAVRHVNDHIGGDDFVFSDRIAGNNRKIDNNDEKGFRFSDSIPTSD